MRNQKSKNLLIFSGYHLPHLGGIERYTDNLSQEFKKLGWNIKDFPNAYSYYENLITLPLNTKLSDEDVEYVCTWFEKIVKEYM